MPIVCSLRTKRLVWTLTYIVVCFGLGAWGAYDYWVRIPRSEQEYREFESVKSNYDSLQKKADEGKKLTAAEVAMYDASKKRVAEFQPPPSPVPAWDRPLQLYVYTIGCGILSTAWFIWSLRKSLKNQVKLTDTSDDGVLQSADEAIEVRQVVGIDMSRWMSKSIAVVRGPNGRSIEIDDYLLQDGEQIVGFFAHRFEPTEWTIDAKRVTKDADDGKKTTPSSAATPPE